MKAGNGAARTVITRPGRKVRVSGIYVIVFADGSPFDPDGGEFTLAAGDTTPATPIPGLVYMLVRRTRHKGDTPAVEEEASDGR